MLKIDDLKEGMKIKAVGDWADCWKDGDEFVVKMEVGEGHAPLPYIDCHDPDGGPHHGLDGTAEENGDLPFDLVS